ncbi:apolipoprotein N-acyltransferase [Methyloceanibacter sp.]|uniref:apolipoprotein N-acyltransferase n=1 Tax=Methyloceanibacter sp. TaxID=1965321 RepID=UPI002D4C42F0|nr:apolipoprotein N-acyltransferase [Methyloceanibacter sp.]HZP09012.1 apolipoprotein N-acyltransferase [Methyloceanibacter sp.]
MLSKAGSPLERLATWVAGLSGWRRALFTVVLGVLSVLAFAPFHLWPVLFFTLGPLVWLLDGCHRDHDPLAARLKCASLTGFWFGFGYFLSGLYWVAEAFLVEPWRHGWLIPLVMTALPAGMALFLSAAAALAMLLWRRGAARAFALAIAFGLAEYARGHVLTGLPWNLIGYSILGGEAMMQLASLFGVYALSLIAALLFASLAALAAPKGSDLGGGKGTIALAVSLLVLLGAGTLWGAQRLARADTTGTGIKIRIVQADIDQAEKWRPENSAEIFNDYLALTKSGVNGLSGISLVVWPETAVPFLLADSPEALSLIADALPQGTSLLVGSARLVEERDQNGALTATRIYNSLLVIDDKGQVLGGYDKIHLVPFGEYLPFQDFMESMGFMQLTGVRGGFSAGTGPRRLAVPGAPPAIPLICYEIIFPDEIADISATQNPMPLENKAANISDRPGWMLNVTNDAWFGTSAGPYQHFQQARVRAVEQGLPLIRAANTGISAIVDPYGRILAEIGLGEKGAIDSELPKAGHETLFARRGAAVEISVLLLAFSAWLACCVQPIRPRR